MSDRRNRPANRWGCKPTEDVCVEHDMPLICPHGCNHSKQHSCKFLSEQAIAMILSREHPSQEKP